MTDALPSYSKIFHLGHRILDGILQGAPLVVEEKIDGSQFSFGVRGGKLHMRSKRIAIHGMDDAPNLFQPTVRHVIACFEEGLLVEGWTYRGEALHAPRHNTLTYARAPLGNLVLFDVDMGIERYASPTERTQIAHDLGVEAVRVLGSGGPALAAEAAVRAFLANTSQLGGAIIEGVVIKPQEAICGPDGKRLIAKFVSEAFKETHSKEYVPGTIPKADIVATIAASLATPARWQKSVQRLRDEGKLKESPEDIGPLIAEVKGDVLSECEDEIKDMLYASYKKQLVGMSTRGLPEWYKEQLAFGGAHGA